MNKLENYVHAFIAAEDLVGDTETQEKFLDLIRDHIDVMKPGQRKDSCIFIARYLEDSMCKYIAFGSRKILQNHALEMIKQVAMDELLEGDE